MNLLLVPAPIWLVIGLILFAMALLVYRDVRDDLI